MARELKELHLTNNVGKAKYVVSYHNGNKFHKDGSKFFDVAIFSNKRKKESFVKDLKKKGYVEK